MNSKASSSNCALRSGEARPPFFVYSSDDVRTPVGRPPFCPSTVFRLPTNPGEWRGERGGRAGDRPPGTGAPSAVDRTVRRGRRWRATAGREGKEADGQASEQASVRSAAASDYHGIGRSDSMELQRLLPPPPPVNILRSARAHARLSDPSQRSALFAQVPPPFSPLTHRWTIAATRPQIPFAVR